MLGTDERSTHKHKQPKLKKLFEAIATSSKQTDTLKMARYLPTSIVVCVVLNERAV